jgi:hypothetical protein
MRCAPQGHIGCINVPSTRIGQATQRWHRTQEPVPLYSQRDAAFRANDAAFSPRLVHRIGDTHFEKDLELVADQATSWRCLFTNDYQ